MKKNKQQNREFITDTQLSSNISPGEIIIGTIVNINSQNQPMVNYPDNDDNNSVIAVSTLDINIQHIDRQVALLFENGDIKKPVIMGLIHNPLQDMIDNFKEESKNDDIELWPSDTKYQTKKNQENTKLSENISGNETSIDGRRIVLEGKEEIVLKCGESSITLSKAGKIIIRGKYLLNRSSGVNRIMGGSVQVN